MEAVGLIKKEKRKSPDLLRSALLALFSAGLLFPPKTRAKMGDLRRGLAELDWKRDRLKDRVTMIG